MNQATLRSTLRTNLLARSNLTAISTEVHRYPPGDRARAVPTIILDEWSASAEGLDLAGSATDRTYTLTGNAYAPTTGVASDDGWDDGEINATTLVEELMNAIEADHTIGGTCGYAELSTWTMSASQDPDTNRTYFDVEFTITIRQVE